MTKRYISDKFEKNGGLATEFLMANGVVATAGTNITIDVTNPNNPVINASGVGGEIVYNVKNNGVLGDGIDLTDGNITTGTNIFTSSSAVFSSSDIGKVITILGAVTGGGFLVTTILGFTNTTTVTLTDNATVTVTGSRFYYGTDDTVAIQTLLQTVFDDGGGVLFFPKSVYIIAGALQTSVGAYFVNPNSQLWIPYDNSEFTDLRGRPVIEIRGEVSPSLDVGSALVGRVASNKGSILRSTIQGSGTEPSVIANRGGAPNDNNQGKSRTNLLVKNLQIQICANTSNKLTIGGINGTHSNNLNVEYVVVTPYSLSLDTELSKPDVIECTGIAMPNINCDLINTLRNTVVLGFTHGYKLGEHTSGYQVNAIGCVNAFTFTETSQTTTMEMCSTHWCVYDINIPTGTIRSYFQFLFMQMEWRAVGDWYDSLATINDIDNVGIGNISFNIVEAGLGLNNEKFKRIGAENVITKPVSVAPINVIGTTTYTLKYTDGYRFIDCYHATLDQVITVPNSSSVTFDKNTRIVINRNGAFNVDIVGAAGVDLQYPIGFLPGIRQQYDGIELVYRGNNKWALFGALKTA